VQDVKKPRKVLTTTFGVAMALVAVLAAGCSASSGGSGSAQAKTQKAYAPKIVPADFSTKIDNKYFPLKPGTTFAYTGKTAGGSEGDIMKVTSDTMMIMGVKCVVVDDRVFEGGKLTEKTHDWYAQDNKGNVWYFGEDSKEIKNGKDTSTGGSWEAGKKGAKPGIIMPADPKVGKTYRQEYSKGVAEDRARVLKLDGLVKVPYGSYDHVLVTEEFIPLEPGVVERQYYVAGVGDIVEATVKGQPERSELADVKTGERLRTVPLIKPTARRTAGPTR
jgi:hypothetical protein